MNLFEKMFGGNKDQTEKEAKIVNIEEEMSDEEAIEIAEQMESKEEALKIGDKVYSSLSKSEGVIKENPNGGIKGTHYVEFENGKRANCNPLNLTKIPENIIEVDFNKDNRVG